MRRRREARAVCLVGQSFRRNGWWLRICDGVPLSLFELSDPAPAPLNGSLRPVAHLALASHARTGKSHNHPILFLDVDGVISLFGFRSGSEPPGQFHWVDGIAHCISDGRRAQVAPPCRQFELVWATGWEEKANEYLPAPARPARTSELPVLTFDGRAVFGTAHWKLEAIDEYAADRPAAWIDDSLDERCSIWAGSRAAPTLLVETDPAVGITDEHVERLLDWAVASLALVVRRWSQA